MRTERVLVLTEKNNDVLEHLKNELGIEPSKAVNELVKSICRCPRPVRDDLIRHIKQSLVILYKKLDGADDALSREILDQVKVYKTLIKYFNSGYEEIEEDDEISTLVRIEMSGCYLLYPIGWILLNEKDAQNCQCALLCDIKESDLPHFVYFHNNKKLGDLGEQFFSDIFEACCSKCPQLSTSDYRKMRFNVLSVHELDKPEHYDSIVIEDDEL